MDVEKVSSAKESDDNEKCLLCDQNQDFEFSYSPKFMNF